MWFTLRTKVPQQKAYSGFTLAELIVTVGIIAILGTVISVAGISIVRRAQAARIANDFKKIEQAWKAWRIDAQASFPLEDLFYTGVDRGLGGCYGDEPYMSESALYNNTAAPSTLWNGPYLSAVPRTPYGDQEYQYDNDNNEYISGDCSTVMSGVNITIAYCSQYDRLEKIAPLIDKALDGKVDRCAGRFRWTDNTNVQGFHYLIDENRP
jgi:prepilin-type N-terminal cleavage/methylation domain-containing protein